MPDQSSMPSPGPRYRPARLSAHFKRSWFDRCVSSLDSSRGPYWLKVSLLTAAFSALTFAASSLQSDPLTWDPVYSYSALQILYTLLVLSYLKQLAGDKFDASNRGLNLEEEKYKEVKNRLINTPRQTANLGTALGGAFALSLTLTGVLAPDIYREFTDIELTLSVAGLLTESLQITIWTLNGLFIAFIIHKLRMIDAIYRHWMQVNPFQPSPLYNLANYSGTMAIIWILPALPWIILDSGPFSLIVGSFFSLLGLLIYITPLLGVHRMLDRVKNDWLSQNGIQIQETISSMNEHFRSNELEAFASLDAVLQGLERARSAIRRVSTWPWQVENFRRVIAALFLPVIIWLIQYFLNQLLSN